jgi:hypothetical protein
MYALEIINKMINALLGTKCNHPHMNQFNSGIHCPDCGEIINVSWITVRCQQCKALRMPKIINQNKVVPLEKYCTNCGSEKWFSSRSGNLNFSEYMYGISVKEVLEEDKTSEESKTDVWVEQSDKSETRHFNNVIKAAKKFR